MWKSNIKADPQLRDELFVCRVICWVPPKDSVLHTWAGVCVAIGGTSRAYAYSTSKRTSFTSLPVTEWDPDQHIKWTSYVFNLTLAPPYLVIRPWISVMLMCRWKRTTREGAVAPDPLTTGEPVSQPGTIPMTGCSLTSCYCNANRTICVLL